MNNQAVDACLDVLSKSLVPLTSKHILREAKKARLLDQDEKNPTVNKALYSLLKQQKVVKHEATPPLWELVRIDPTNRAESDEESSTESMTYILVDVANCPYLAQLEPYAAANVQILAIATHEYANHVPTADYDNLIFKRLDEHSNRSRVGVEFAVWLTEKLARRPRGDTNVTVILVSKSASVWELSKVIFDVFDIRCSLINDWEGLRELIE